MKITVAAVLRQLVERRDKGVNRLSFMASHVEFRSLEYDIAALHEVAVELLFYHVIPLAVFRGQGKGAQDIVRFVSHRVNEGVHLRFVVLHREPRGHAEALEAAYPLRSPFGAGEVERLGRGDLVLKTLPWCCRICGEVGCSVNS